MEGLYCCVEPFPRLEGKKKQKPTQKAWVTVKTEIGLQKKNNRKRLYLPLQGLTNAV